MIDVFCHKILAPGSMFCAVVITSSEVIKIEYHAVGDTWWQPLLSYGNCT